MGRGMLTQAVQDAALVHLERKITVRELRLMPYCISRLMDNANLDPNHISQEDREILSEWRKEEWISGGASDFEISPKFWDAITSIVYFGYIDT